MLKNKHIDTTMTRIARAAVDLSVAALHVPDCTRYVLYFRQERVGIADVADENLQSADRPLDVQRAAVEKMVKDWQNER